MSTWNPSDKDPNVTLSGANLIASITASSYGGVRSTDSHSTGKWYFEVVVVGVGNVNGCSVGVENTGDYLNYPVGESYGYGLVCTTGANKNYKYHFGVPGVLDNTTPADGDVLMVALDLTNSKIWFGRNGTWYGSSTANSGDPAAGTNPAFTSVADTFFAAWTGSYGIASSGTARFSSSSTTYTRPSGFLAWDGSGGSVTVSADGSAAGTSTADAYAAVPWAVGTSTALAVGQTIKESIGTAVGISVVSGSSVLISRRNWLYGPDAHVNAIVRVGEYDGSGQYFPPYTWGVTTPQLKDGNKAGSVYTLPAGTNLVIGADFGTTRLVDKITIWSSSVSDPSDQLAYPTFTLAQNGLIGNVDEEITIYGAVTGTYSEIVAARVTGNRATKLEINIPQQDIRSFFIMGQSPIGIKPGTVVTEIEASQTYTLYDATFQSTANVVSNIKLGRTLTLVSTANATSAVSGFEVQTEVSHSNVTSSVNTQADVTLVLNSTADATSSVSGDISFALVSTANVTSVVPKTPLVATYDSTASATSSTSSRTTRTNTLVSTANATSSVRGGHLIQLVSTANATSNLAKTAITSGALVSTANVTSSVTGSHSIVVWDGISHADVASSVSGNTHAHSTYVSTANIRAYIILPGLPEGLSSLWCNPITHAAASWSGTPFESVIEVDGVMYGAGVDGIYKMENELDEETEVSAYVTWDLLDFGDPRKHRPGDFMIDGTAGAPLKVTVANEQGRYSYLTHLPENTKPTNFRARLGKGLHSRHLRFTVENTKSKEFWFDTAEIEVIQLSRHIGGRHA